MEKVLLLLPDDIYVDTTDQLRFEELGGRGSRAAASFEDFGQSI